MKRYKNHHAVRVGCPRILASPMSKRLERLFVEIDDLMRIGAFGMLNSKMSSVPVDKVSTDELIAYLTATLPAKDKLPSRAKFFHDVQTVLFARKEWSSDLVRGLE